MLVASLFLLIYFLNDGITNFVRKKFYCYSSLQSHNISESTSTPCKTNQLNLLLQLDPLVGFVLFIGDMKSFLTEAMGSSTF
jgi:hypothetical protein